MGTAEIASVSLALSIDALAVSMAASASDRIGGARGVFRLSFHFGLFQFLMPLLGWSVGIVLSPVTGSLSRWLAAVLLTIVAVRMLVSDPDAAGAGSGDDVSRGMTLVALSTAVSLDALAVGVGLAMLGIDVWAPAAVIGIVTTSMTLAGILIGGRLHARFGRSAERLAGIVLLLVAIRVLI